MSILEYRKGLGVWRKANTGCQCVVHFVSSFKSIGKLQEFELQGTANKGRLVPKQLGEKKRQVHWKKGHWSDWMKCGR